MDGSIHSLHQLSLTLKQHTHLHKKNSKPGCEFCFPPKPEPQPQPPDVVAPVQNLVMEQSSVQEVPEKPEIVEVKQEVAVEIETEVEALTAMAAAFNQAAFRRTKKIPAE